MEGGGRRVKGRREKGVIIAVRCNPGLPHTVLHPLRTSTAKEISAHLNDIRRCGCQAIKV